MFKVILHSCFFLVTYRQFQQFARTHFGCDQLEGIEAEDEKKIHLSEYIYGVSKF